jgi:Na+/proline symporter
MPYGLAAIALISVVMANMNSNIYILVATTTTLLLVALFVLLTMGLYWKKASCAGALAAIFGGAATWLACELAATEIPHDFRAVGQFHGHGWLRLAGTRPELCRLPGCCGRSKGLKVIYGGGLLWT